MALMGNLSVISVLRCCALMINRFRQVEGELKLGRSDQIGEKQRNEKSDAKESDVPGFHKYSSSNYQNRTGNCQMTVAYLRAVNQVVRNSTTGSMGSRLFKTKSGL